jgi:hypothetical protein
MENLLKKFYSIEDGNNKVMKFFHNEETKSTLGGIVKPYERNYDEFFKKRFEKDLFFNTKIPNNSPSFEKLLFTQPKREVKQDIANAMKVQIIEQKIKRLECKRVKVDSKLNEKAKSSDGFYYKKGDELVNMMMGLKGEVLERLDSDGKSNRKIVNDLYSDIGVVKMNMIDLASAIKLQQSKQEDTLKWLIDERNSRNERNRERRLKSIFLLI